MFTAVLILPCPMLLAEDHSWPLDPVDSSKLSVHGEVTGAPGVEGKSAVLDGASLLKVKDSEQLTGGVLGQRFFTTNLCGIPRKSNPVRSKKSADHMRLVFSGFSNFIGARFQPTCSAAYFAQIGQSHRAHTNSPTIEPGRCRVR